MLVTRSVQLGITYDIPLLQTQGFSGIRVQCIRVLTVPVSVIPGQTACAVHLL